MKTGEIIKAFDIADECSMLEKVNQYTRRDFRADELYMFSVILCDNEIDRDNERFTVSALNKLAELFKGKTGIFDHNPKGQNQTSRIFDTEIITDASKTTKAGEPYTYLQAHAYMVRSDTNADMILSIDAGVIKEVSVGCQMDSLTCSVCGEDMKKAGCRHQRGQVYNGNQYCHGVLDNPKDAYEFSFVAIPAQRNAGVVKEYDIPAYQPSSDDEAMRDTLKKIIIKGIERGSHYEHN